MEKLPAEIYEQIKQNTPKDLDARVLTIMHQHKGKENKIGRRELVEQTFNIQLPLNVNLSSLSIDRMVRRSLERLSKVTLIVGSSGEGGYWIADNPKQVEQIIIENQRKAEKLRMKSSRMYMLSLKEFGTQMSLLGVERKQHE